MTTSPAGWLPRDRDQLTLVPSMGLFTLQPMLTRWPAPLTASALNQLDQYTNSPGNWACGYAELAVFYSSSGCDWWQYITVSMANHQCTSATSVHRLSPFPFVLDFALLTTMTWLYHVLRLRVMVRAVSASRHPRFGTCCHLISRTVMFVANSSSRALRLGSLCKPTHKRHVWELCLSGALQILDLIWLLIASTWLSQPH